MKRSYFCGASAVAVALSTTFWSHAAFAADAAAAAASSSTAATPTEVGEVVVTGSLIQGTPKDAPIPVDVVSTDTLAKQGSPSAVQLVKTLTASTSGLGESNRYNGGAGTATVNLRGFGSSRTLALFNGRRMADTPQAAFQGGGADLNFIPQAAIGRIEILKDGAAATYGSEAIGGVVNFITRTDLNGVEFEGDYTGIRSTKGDYRASVAWGWKGDRVNTLLTFGYRHRSRLDAQDRDWAVRSFQSPFSGGWSGNSNPGNYILNTPNGPAATLFRDNGCNELGGQLTRTSAVPANGTVPISTGSGTSATCRFQFTNFNDLVNQEDHYQL
jgi:iron complex outermembrane receptor protein